MTPSPPRTDGNPDVPMDGIVARDVTVTYRNGLTALSHASFAVPRGTVRDGAPRPTPLSRKQKR